MPFLGRLLGRPARTNHHQEPRSLKFSKDQVRVLLFRDCERTGRKLLFDSSSVQKVSAAPKSKGYLLQQFCKSNKDVKAKESKVIEAQEFKYQSSPPNADVNGLSEMIFGSVAMNFKGMSLKVHFLDSPERLMYTKVFPMSGNRRYRTHTMSENENSPGTSKVINRSNPLNYTSNKLDNSKLSSSFDVPKCNNLNRDDSGLGGEVSSHSSIGSCSNYNSFSSVWDTDDQFGNYCFGYPHKTIRTTSGSSIQWRLNRHYSTSFNCSSNASRKSSTEVSPLLINESQGRNYSATNESTSGISTCSRSSNTRQGKMGIAILIDLTEKMESQMIRFLMEHALLIEFALDRLRLSLQIPHPNPQSFITKMALGTDETAQWLSDLLTGPRINVPLWIGLAGSQKSTNDALADKFIQDLCYLLNNIDTKNTYFFMSTLITQVLTYHLGWVNSVSPYNSSPVNQQKELDSLSRNHPYNPLWAQIGELYGAIGAPARVAKTIVCGKENTHLIQRIISVLSYFIRCGEVKRTNIDCKSTPWESLDVFVDNQNSFNNSINKIDLNCDQSNGDCIEMITFSSNHFDEKENSFSTDLNEIDYKPKFTVENNEDNPKMFLKRNKSFALFNKSDSSLSSIKTVVSNGLQDTTNNFLQQKSSNGWGCGDISIAVTNETNSMHNGNSSNNDSNSGVVFVLGENETLVGLKDKVKEDHKAEQSSDAANNGDKLLLESNKSFGNLLHPDACCTKKSTCKHSNLIKHSREKFEFNKYPRIVTNYMKSKNLELLDRHVVGKPGNLKIDGLEVERNLNIVTPDCERCTNCSYNTQILQTPSNASELEYVSDIPSTHCSIEIAQEKIVSNVIDDSIQNKVFIRKKLENTVIINNTKINSSMQTQDKRSSAELVELPMPPVIVKEEVLTDDSGYCHTLIGGVTDHYIADMVLQGLVSDVYKWETQIRRDLMLHKRTAPGGAACLIADTDNWSVNVWGSGSGSGGMSTLIAAMLDTLMRMQRAQISSRQCLTFIESKLRELCIRSKTLAELLLKTDFCDMNSLTKTLNLEPNDVPLLMAIASTHSPDIMLKYGVSFR